MVQTEIHVHNHTHTPCAAEPSSAGATRDPCTLPRFKYRRGRCGARSGRAPAARRLPHGTWPSAYTPPLCTPPGPAARRSPRSPDYMRGDAAVDVAKVAVKVAKAAGKIAKVAVHNLRGREPKAVRTWNSLPR